MSKYVENNLGTGEKIVLKAQINWLAVLPNAIWFVVMLVLAIVCSVMIGNAVGVIKGEVSTEEYGWFVKLFATVMGHGGAEVLDKIAGTFYGAIWGFWFLVAVLPLIIRILTLNSISIAITNRRVIGKVGIIGIKTVDYPIEKVDNIKIEAGIFGNLLKYHTLCVLGGGNGQPINFKGIGNATMFKNTFTEALELHHENARKAQAEEIARAMGK